MDEIRGRDGDELYSRDFERWAELQARHLREGRHDLLDRANLIEEIESLGKSQESELMSR